MTDVTGVNIVALLFVKDEKGETIINKRLVNVSKQLALADALLEIDEAIKSDPRKWGELSLRLVPEDLYEAAADVSGSG